jgi:hypothetical protein
MKKEFKKTTSLNLTFDVEIFERMKKAKQEDSDVKSWEEFIYKKVLK